MPDDADGIVGRGCVVEVGVALCGAPNIRVNSPVSIGFADDGGVTRTASGGGALLPTRLIGSAVWMCRAAGFGLNIRVNSPPCAGAAIGAAGADANGSSDRTGGATAGATGSGLASLNGAASACFTAHTTTHAFRLSSLRSASAKFARSASGSKSPIRFFALSAISSSAHPLPSTGTSRSRASFPVARSRTRNTCTMPVEILVMMSKRSSRR